MKIFKLLVQKIINLTQSPNNFGTKTKVEFNGSCLRQDKIIYDHEKVLAFIFFFEISQNFDSSD